MKVSKYILNKCNEIRPNRSKDLYRYYEDCIDVCNNSANNKSYKKRCTEVFSGLKNSIDIKENKFVEGEISKIISSDGWTNYAFS